MARLVTASMANVRAAMSVIMCVIASCLPIGLPHCTRSFDQRRTTPRQAFAVPTEMFGMERRPSLRVVSAILRPLPSCPIRFSAGTRTSLKSITAFEMARRPMKRQRCSTLTPGQSASTTKALIFFVSGAIAITTSSFASVPFVVHSFFPLTT